MRVKLLSVVFRGWEWKKEIVCRGTWENSGIMEMFCVLIVMAVTWLYILVKIQPTVYLKRINFSVCWGSLFKLIHCYSYPFSSAFWNTWKRSLRIIHLKSLLSKGGSLEYDSDKMGPKILNNLNLNDCFRNRRHRALSNECKISTNLHTIF